MRHENDVTSEFKCKFYKHLGSPNLATIAKLDEIVKIGGSTQLITVVANVKWRHNATYTAAPWTLRNPSAKPAHCHLAGSAPSGPRSQPACYRLGEWPPGDALIWFQKPPRHRECVMGGAYRLLADNARVSDFENELQFWMYLQNLLPSALPVQWTVTVLPFWTSILAIAWSEKLLLYSLAHLCCHCFENLPLTATIKVQLSQRKTKKQQKRSAGFQNTVTSIGCFRWEPVKTATLQKSHNQNGHTELVCCTDL